MGKYFERHLIKEYICMAKKKHMKRRSRLLIRKTKISTMRYHYQKPIQLQINTKQQTKDRLKPTASGQWIRIVSGG